MQAVGRHDVGDENVVLSVAALTEDKAWLLALEGITAWYGFDTIDELLIRLDLGIE